MRAQFRSNLTWTDSRRPFADASRRSRKRGKRPPELRQARPNRKESRTWVCAFCHVQGKMEADDKRPKQTARAMMAMTAAINANSFHGQRQVTCYSCHRGATHPVNKPLVQEPEAPMR